VLHTVLIGLHAVSGGTSFFAGIVALRRGRLFWVHFWALVGTMVFLAFPIAVEWGGLGTAERAMFTAFMVLGLYMLWRAAQASRVRPTPETADRGPALSYVVHMGFNLIALFDAFTVILVLDLGGPGWLIVTAAVVVAVIGHQVRRSVESHLVRRSTSEPQPSANFPG
jgi:hypothetical protein